MAIEIHAFETGPVATFGYLLIDEETKSALIVDAPPDSADVMTDALAKGDVEPTALILTHTHWDHTADVAELKRRFPEMLVYVHPADEYRLIDPMSHTVWRLPFLIEGLSADRHLTDGDTFTLGPFTFAVLHTPGHTEGSICLYDESRNLLFAGDTLFEGSVGRTDLPGGSWETLLDSITRRLLPLPDDVRLYPGHGPATTIGREREANPFLH